MRASRLNKAPMTTINLTQSQLRRRRAEKKRRASHKRRLALFSLLFMILGSSAAFASFGPSKQVAQSAPSHLKGHKVITRSLHVKISSKPKKRGRGLLAAPQTPTSTAPSQSTFLCPYPDSLRGAFDYAAEQTGLDRSLLAAIAFSESRFQTSDESGAGAVGVMQITRPTAEAIGINPDNTWENIVGGARYLKSLVSRFNSTYLAIAAYNAGPSAVSAYQGVPPYPETLSYVSQVSAYQAHWAGCA
jgi:soluble lytic murein transglycosylase-like protein